MSGGTGRVGDKRIGVGVIGLGFMGRTHLASYARTPGVAIRAAFDPAPRTSAAGNLIPVDDDVGRILAALPHASSLGELLARPDVDLVSICTPTDTHVELVAAAIAAGKHVLVEKPVSLDAAAIDRLDAAARAHGVLVMPAHCMRFWPAWAWMAEAVRTRRFGRVRGATFRRLGAAPGWSRDFYLDVRRSGGAIVDLHVHDADFVRFAFGEPETVEARGTRRHVVARYAFSDGRRVEAEGGWMDDPAFAFLMVATIDCERAVIDFRLGREPEVLVLEREPTGEGLLERPLVPGRDYPLGNGYDHEIAALVEAIRSGEPAPVTLADAAATQRLLDREIASIGE